MDETVYSPLTISPAFRYRLDLAYDGTPFLGWQRQAIPGSIQEKIESAFSGFSPKPTVIGASRTDRGVHAEGQVAHIDLPRFYPEANLLRALNSRLPKEIRVTKIVHCKDSFHARFGAVRKRYEYRIDLNPNVSPFLCRYVYHHPYEVDLSLAEAAFPYLLGTHNFSAFQNLSGEHRRNPKKKEDTVRTLFSLHCIEQNGRVVFTFEGDGFLYNMVRNLVGLFLSLAKGKISLETFILAKKEGQRAKLPATAPPSGLHLTNVYY